MPPPQRAFRVIALLFLLLALLAFGASSFRASLPLFFQVVIEGLNNFDYAPAP